MSIVLPTSRKISILEGMIGMGGALESVVIGLYKNDFSPTPSSVVGDFTAADFDGYALSAELVWGEVFLDEEGNAITLAQLLQFHADSPFTEPNTIYGYYAVDAGGGGLIYSERFEDPVPIASADDAVIFTPAFRLGQMG